MRPRPPTTINVADHACMYPGLLEREGEEERGREREGKSEKGILVGEEAWQSLQV